MAKVYYDQDAGLEILEDKTVAVIGYGSQGRAQALNMKDSGLNVVVGLREGKSWKAAKSEGLDVQPVPKAAEMGDLIVMLIPDMAQPEVYRKSIAPSMEDGKALGFSHGFNIHFKQIKPPATVDVVMVAPKSPGARLRELYKEGFGVPALFAVHQDPSGEGGEKALAWAKALGCTRAGVLETTFKDETESDLIGEQTVLVGGLIELINNGFQVLVKEGYPAELAYFEACNEAKLIMDLIYQKGITGMLRAVSDTAKYGGLTVGKRVIDERVKENMKRAAARVKSGDFADEWIAEYRKGMPEFNRLMKEVEGWEIEKVGRVIRKMAGIEK